VHSWSQRFQSRLLVVAALLVWFALGSGAGSAAQASGRAPLPGDGFWMFDQRGVFADERVAAAIAHFVDSRAVFERAGLDPDRQLFYLDGTVIPVLDGLTDAGAVELFSAAVSGLDSGAERLHERQTCRLWPSINPYGETPDEKMSLAVALGEEIATALNRLGIEARPCALVERSAHADVFLLSYGQNIPVGVGVRPDLDAFLVSSAEAPRPADSGNGGTAGAKSGLPWPAWAALVGVLASLSAGIRRYLRVPRDPRTGDASR